MKKIFFKLTVNPKEDEMAIYTDEMLKNLRKRWGNRLLEQGTYSRDDTGKIIDGTPYIINQGGWSKRNQINENNLYYPITTITTFQELLDTTLH